MEAAQALWAETGLRVMGGDFARYEPPAADDGHTLLVTNPPYVRHHHISRADKERLKAQVRRHLGIEISGLAGLYCYFLLLADRWLREGGLSIWLVPSEFLDVNYGVAIKRYLKENVKLLHIHCFHPADMQFADALVSSAVVVFEKRTPVADHQVCFSQGGSLLKPQTSYGVSWNDLRVKEKWTRHLRPQRGAADNGARRRTLGELFAIKRGLATGANRFFILPRAEARKRGIPEAFLKPILPGPRQLPEAVIAAGPDGYPRTEPQLALLDCRLPEAEVRRRFPTFWSYLEKGKAEKVHEGYLASRRSPWYAQEDRPPAPFLCTYMGRPGNGRKPFRFLWNQSAATAHNVYLLLYPRGALRTALAAEPALYGLIFQALQQIDTASFMGEGRVYGGGLYKMEPKELAAISAAPILEALRGRWAGPGLEHMAPLFEEP